MLVLTVPGTERALGECSLLCKALPDTSQVLNAGPRLPVGHRLPAALGGAVIHLLPDAQTWLTYPGSRHLRSCFPSFSFNFHYINFTFPGIEILNDWTHLEIESAKGLIYIDGALSLARKEAQTRMDGSGSRLRSDTALDVQVPVDVGWDHSSYVGGAWMQGLCCSLA